MNANDEAGQACESDGRQGEGQAAHDRATDIRSPGSGDVPPEMPPHTPPRTPRSIGGDLTSVGRFLWTHNPFYVVSACLTLYGLRIAFSEAEASSWWLLGVLVGYTALMAATGFVVVRWGKVWDDARSIILVVALLFFAVSISLDEIGIEDTSLAFPLIATAFVCVVAISQTMLWGMKIRLGSLYLVPYYAILAISFFHPLAVMLYQEHGDAANNHAIAWGLLVFPLIQGGAFLTLLPAIRKGLPYARNNGTPWRWPRFPLLLFAVLWGAVCVRHFCMAGSFMPAANLDMPFGLYSISPLVLCGAIVVLELGLMLERRKMHILALLVPMIALVASLSPSRPSPIYADTLQMVRASLASPMLLSLGAAFLFYLYAALRRVRCAEWGLVAALLAGSFIDGETIGLSTLAAPQPLPLLILAALELVQGVRRRSSPRLFVALAASIAAAYPALPAAWPPAGRTAAAVHTAVFGVMTVGLISSDRFARRLLSLAAFALATLPLAVFALHTKFLPGIPAWILLTYTAALAALSLGYWGLTRNASFLATAIVNAFWLTCGLAAYGWKETRRFLQFRGAYPIAFGSLSFLAAVAISLAKGRATARVCSGRENAKSEKRKLV